MADWHLLPVVYLFYILALIVNIIAVLSLPYGSAFIVEIQFNEETFSGSVNGMSVQNLSSLRLGIWAACYDVSLGSGSSNPCSEATIPYQITMTRTNDNTTRTIVQPLWTIGLVIQAFALLATIIATFLTIGCQKQYSNRYWVEIWAVILTLAAAAADGILYWLVKSEMQSVGETIVTNLGTAFGWIVAAILCLCTGAILRHVFAKEVDKKDEEPPKIKMSFISSSPLASLASKLHPPQPEGLPPAVTENEESHPRNGAVPTTVPTRFPSPSSSPARLGQKGGAPTPYLSTSVTPHRKVVAASSNPVSMQKLAPLGSTASAPLPLGLLGSPGTPPIVVAGPSGQTPSDKATIPQWSAIPLGSSSIQPPPPSTFAPQAQSAPFISMPLPSSNPLSAPSPSYPSTSVPFPIPEFSRNKAPPAPGRLRDPTPDIFKGSSKFNENFTPGNAK